LLLRLSDLSRHFPSPKVSELSKKRQTIRFRLAGGLHIALDLEVGSDIQKNIAMPTITNLPIFDNRID